MSLIETDQTRYEHIGDSPLVEIFAGMRKDSIVMPLDFSQIPPETPDTLRIDRFFETAEARGINPRLPEERQRFNDALLAQTGKKYLIGRYLENRIAMLAGSWIAKEGRTYHLGIDIFTSGLELLHAPTTGTVVRSDREEGSHTYGYYTILEHVIDGKVLYGFYGHLSAKLPPVGTIVQSGQPFAQLGDFVNDENGGWSRHVHVQLLQELPDGEGWPTGYSTFENLAQDSKRFPDPNLLLQIPGLG